MTKQRYADIVALWAKGRLGYRGASSGRALRREHDNPPSWSDLHDVKDSEDTYCEWSEPEPEPPGELYAIVNGMNVNRQVFLSNTEAGEVAKSMATNQGLEKTAVVRYVHGRHVDVLERFLATGILAIFGGDGRPRDVRTVEDLDLFLRLREASLAKPGERPKAKMTYRVAP